MIKLKVNQIVLVAQALKQIETDDNLTEKQKYWLSRLAVKLQPELELFNQRMHSLQIKARALGKPPAESKPDATEEEIQAQKIKAGEYDQAMDALNAESQDFMSQEIEIDMFQLRLKVSQIPKSMTTQVLIKLDPCLELIDDLGDSDAEIIPLQIIPNN